MRHFRDLTEERPTSGLYHGRSKRHFRGLTEEQPTSGRLYHDDRSGISVA